MRHALPHIEAVECRLLLAAAFWTLEEGVLTIIGTEAADTITLLTWESNNTNETQHIELTVNGQSETLYETYPARVIIEAGAGADRVDCAGNSGDTFHRFITEVRGGSGDDSIDCGRATLADGGAGDDRLVGWDDLGNRSDTGGSGSSLVGGTGNDVLYGSDDADDLLGGDDNDKIFAGGGDDTMRGWNGDDTIDAGAGEDFVYGGDGLDKIFGGDGDDLLSGNANKDTIDGGLGNDRLNGNGGHDRLFGYAGADRLYGYDGNDYLDGGSSNDRLAGGLGIDTLLGNGGDDRLLDMGLDLSTDQLFGGTGKDSGEVDEFDEWAAIESVTVLRVH